MEKNSVIEKIKKLLAVTEKESNATEGEIKNAMMMAKKLMAKHSLSMTDIDLQSEEQVFNSRIGLCKGKMSEWEQSLLYVINLLCDVESVITKRKKWDYHQSKYVRSVDGYFIGYKTDVAIAEALFHSLVKTIRIMRRKYMKENKMEIMVKTEVMGVSKGKIKLSYMYGVISRLERRAFELKGENLGLSKTEQEKYGALVVVKNAAIKKYMEENLNIRESRQREKQIDGDAYKKGYDAAGEIDLGTKKRLT